eukprot:2281985-Pleurochrysis_carterae.AAC.1
MSMRTQHVTLARQQKHAHKKRPQADRSLPEDKARHCTLSNRACAGPVALGDKPAPTVLSPASALKQPASLFPYTFALLLRQPGPL